MAGADHRFERNLPKRGPSGVTLFLLGGVAIGAGMYRVIQGSDRRRYASNARKKKKKMMMMMVVEQGGRSGKSKIFGKRGWRKENGRKKERARERERDRERERERERERDERHPLKQEAKNEDKER